MTSSIAVTTAGASAPPAPGEPGGSRHSCHALTANAHAMTAKQASMTACRRRTKNPGGGSEVVREAPRDGRKAASASWTAWVTAPADPTAVSGTVRRSRTRGRPLGAPVSPDS